MDIENIPIQSTPQGYATPEQIARQRQIAQYLMMGGGQEKKLTHPAQLFGNLANSAVGNMQLNQANALDRSSDLQDARHFAEGTQTPTPGAPTAGPASVRNNNPGAQWPGPVASQFGSTGAQDLQGGNKIASFDDPIKGGAAHFALLAQKYAGMPLGAAIAKWSGGNSAAPYAQFVSGRTGLSPETPITPELLKGPQGIALAKAMADWEAGGRYPMTDQQWMQAHQTAFGGGQPPGAPQTSGGEEAGGGGQALGFSGEAAEGGGNDAMGGIVSALQAPKTGAPPVPGGPVTRAPAEGAPPTNWKDYPDSTLPHRIPMSREALINTLASRRLDPNIKNTALQLYLEQSQPMSMKAPGGTISIGADRQRAFIPELMKGKYKTGDTEAELLSTYNPKTNTQDFVPTGMGGGAGGSVPQSGPLGTMPPSSVSAPAQQAGNSVFPPPIIQQMRDYSNREDTYKHGREQLHKDYEKTAMIGQKAQESLPMLTQMRQMIEDPDLYQGIFAAPVLDWNRVKAAAGSKDGERAAALMQTFEKMRSGQVIKDLGTQFSGLGQIRLKEMELAEKAFANVYNTKEANRAVLEIAIRSNKQLADLAELTSKYIQGYQFDKNGNDVVGQDWVSVIGDPGKTTGAGLQKLKLDWLKAHPMIKPKDMTRYNKLFDDDAKYPAPAKPGKNAAKPVPPPTIGGTELPAGFTKRTPQ